MITATAIVEQKATDNEKIDFLRSCTDHKLFNFLLDDLESSQSEVGTQLDDYRITVRWTRKHPWEIVIKTDLFAKKWGRMSFHSVSRILNQLSSVRVGAYCIFKRQSIGVYRFLGGYHGHSLPIIPAHELCENPRKRKAVPDLLKNITPKRASWANQQPPPLTMVSSVTTQFFTPSTLPPQPSTQLFTPSILPPQQIATNPFASFSPGDFFQANLPRPQNSSVFMNPPTSAPPNGLGWPPCVLADSSFENPFPNVDPKV